MYDLPFRNSQKKRGDEEFVSIRSSSVTLIEFCICHEFFVVSAKYYDCFDDTSLLVELRVVTTQCGDPSIHDSNDSTRLAHISSSQSLTNSIVRPTSTWYRYWYPGSTSRTRYVYLVRYERTCISSHRAHFVCLSVSLPGIFSTDIASIGDHYIFINYKQYKRRLKQTYKKR
jgi:hypothetical protein